MNLILLEPQDFIDPTHAVVKGRRFEHLTRVNQIRKNDCLECGLLNGSMGTGIVRDLSKDAVRFEVRLQSDPPPPLPLTLILALPRPKMLKRIIENITSLGVKRLYLINSWRVEKSFWQSPVLDADQLYRYMILGLEQGKDTQLPVIHLKRFFKRFVTQELSSIAGTGLKIIGHPKAAMVCPSGVNQEATLAIGPEGGFIDIEIETLEQQGFTTCSVGPRILKVETAVTSMISRLYT